MKLITNIQSFTDVITNSSSSVFIMHESDVEYYEGNVPEDCITIQEIDLDWIKKHDWEWELILRACNIDFNEISTQRTQHYSPKCSYTYWVDPSKDFWETWVEENKARFEPILDKYFIEIEDHFEGAWEITENAYDDAIASESRH